MAFQKGSIRRSLYYSILDGLFTAMMLGVSESYLLAYAVALDASAQEVGVLASLPALVAALLQIKSAAVTQKVGSRTRLINVVVFFHALSWLPIILLPYILSRLGRPDWTIPGLVLAATIFMVFQAFGAPAWQSLMSDYIPVKKRGKYFGWRNRLQGVMTVSVSAAAGLVLHAFGKDSIRGFAVIFIFAMFCRFYAWICLTRMTEPFRHASHDAYFSFWAFLKQIRTSNFAKFVLFVSLLNFSANLSGPLLPVFLLRDLGLDYAAFMMLVTGASLSGFVFQGLFGKFGDLDGNIKILRRAAWGIALIPLLWMVCLDPRYLFFVQLLAGAAWGGFNLLVVNFILEATSPAKRIRCLSYFNVVNSVAVFLGASIGGFLMHRLPPFRGYSYLTLFLLSCGMRFLVMIFLSERIKEVRA